MQLKQHKTSLALLIWHSLADLLSVPGPAAAGTLPGRRLASLAAVLGRCCPSLALSLKYCFLCLRSVLISAFGADDAVQ